MTRYFSDTVNILSSIKSVREQPFPFAATLGCLPPELFNQLVATRPQVDGKGNNKRFNLDAKELLEREDLPEIWRDFIEYHTSQSFYACILEKFGQCIKSHYPALACTKVGIRGQDEADIYLDCQIAVNSPVTERSTVSPPHLDHPQELWAALLYMPLPDDNAGGDLVIYECQGEPEIYDKRQVREHNLIPAGFVPYLPNAMGCFMNSKHSIHAVTERNVTDKQRLFVNISLEMPKGKELFNAN